MRHLTLLALGLLATLPLCAQSFSSPESVEYDALRRRWLVSQNGSNRLNTYNPGTGVLTLFSSSITSGPHGLATIGDTLYACDGGRIRGFDLATGTQVLNVNLGASFLNGLTSDGRAYLFATDFSTRKIFRLNTRTGAFNQMATTARTPNGIYYDGARNRCVFVTWGSSAVIQALSLADSTVSTLASTSLSNIDGITRDPAGNWYVAAWGTNALHRFDPTFSGPGLSVMTGLSSPADVAINAAGDSIAIPNAGSANNVVFFTQTVTGLPQAAAPALLPMQCWPNPAATRCVVEVPTALPGATLALFDAQGRLLRRQPLAGTRTQLDLGNPTVGFYRVELRDAAGRLRGAQKLAVMP